MASVRILLANLIGTFWFIPSVVVLAAAFLAIGMVELSALVDAQTLTRWPRIFGVSADGSRSMLAAIAGSMITIAGVTFSITIVAITQASSQYTPRILRNFMRDRANQLVLGIFVGIFTYCLVVLRTVRGPDEAVFVPSLAVFVGMLLAIVGIAVLIFFVHHITTTLQASEIIARIMRETIAVMDRIFPEEMNDDTMASSQSTIPVSDLGPWHQIPGVKTGYIQNVDLSRMTHIAVEHDLMVRVEREIGAFTVATLPIASFAFYPQHRAKASDAPREAHEITKALASLYTVNNYRTIEQDVGFGVRQLVDIALKAMSPGINDITTTTTCIEYLGAILVHIANRRLHTTHRSEDGIRRIVTPGPTFDGLLRLAFEEIRQHAGGHVSVVSRQLEVLENLASVTRPSARRESILAQITLLYNVVERTVELPQDREWLQALAARARAAISSQL